MRVCWGIEPHPKAVPVRQAAGRLVRPSGGGITGYEIVQNTCACANAEFVDARIPNCICKALCPPDKVVLGGSGPILGLDRESETEVDDGEQRQETVPVPVEQPELHPPHRIGVVHETYLETRSTFGDVRDTELEPRKLAPNLVEETALNPREVALNVVTADS